MSKLIFASIFMAVTITSVQAATTINFNSEDYEFSDKEQQLIKEIIVSSEVEVRKLLPSLDENIVVNVHTTTRNLDMVGGVFGRADAPGVMQVTLSTVSENGVAGSANSALSSTMYHELHHLVRGWTMTENKYGQQHGIPIATVNEGLACIFAETYTDQYFPLASDYPEEAGEWLEEIMQLPLDADYGHWVGGIHPDGRSVIGYRVGRYVVHQALKKTGKNIIELSSMEPEEMLNIVLK